MARALVIFGGALVGWLAGGSLPLVAIVAGALMVAVGGRDPADAFAKVERSFPEAIGALISVIEKKDPYLRGHMRRVGELTAQIAAELSLPAESARAMKAR